MPKVLKPYTIIPPDLYVLRAADKQVAQIITDMGRPGYVLVSRQMGKTNLLLNAKRQLETDTERFVYIDLSNTFPDARGCFQNIIDTILDSSPDRFEKAGNAILESRIKSQGFPPHKQHLLELKTILNSPNINKLIIILDEIDALTKTGYSDHIFSQIRSTYFSARVNYKEFNGLTYLLSGVVEPADIIKDPKISPFNIGQNIYLNDFSRAEFIDFLSLAKLSLSPEISDRIYYWTSGNPRITWDVCSEVEDRLVKSELSINDIDCIIRELYLTKFDRPPVDTIREIVANDKDIRNSIIEIEYQKGDLISDKAKSKLYLTGIINFEQNSIRIKNKIIQECLNYEWIKKVEEEKEGLGSVAYSQYTAERYQDALATYERYLSSVEESNISQIDVVYFIMGECAFLIKDYNKSISYFKKVSSESAVESDIIFQLLHYLGLCYYYIKDYKESLLNFQQIIDKAPKNEFYIKTLLHYGVVSLAAEDTDQAESKFNEIICELNSKDDKLSDKYIKEVQTVVYYNLGGINLFHGSIQNAVDYYRQSLTHAPHIAKPIIILALVKNAQTPKEKENLFEQFLHLIEVEKIKPRVASIERTMEFSYEIFMDFLALSFVQFHDTYYIQLCKYLDFLGSKSKTQHLFDLALFVLQNNKDAITALAMFKEIYSLFTNAPNDVNNETKYETIKFVAYLSDNHSREKLHLEFIYSFTQVPHTSIDYIDVNLFASTATMLIEKQFYREALECLRIINSINYTPDEILRDYLFIFQLEIDLLFRLNQDVAAHEKAQRLFSLIKDKKISNLSWRMVDDKLLESIFDYVKSVLKAFKQTNKSIETTNSIERNQKIIVRYNDGRTVEAKYKKLKPDIDKGLCAIIR
jgi:tetratricopeptide (TPR) repeat protein